MQPPFQLQGFKRKLVYALIFEFMAILLTGLALVLLGHNLHSSGGLAVAISVIAVLWNLIWNSLFEAWEIRQSVKGRSLARRSVHAAGFEIGLALFTIPLIAWWLQVSLLEAFILDIGFLIFFLLYAYVFSWCFDKIFGLPLSAQ